MIRAIVWKEWRDQRAIAMAVLAFGALALAATAQFADSKSSGSPWEQAGPRELMAQALAYLAGAVCGSMLLADEKEIGTLEYLDTLPSRRRAIWVGKALAGALFAVVQGLALAATAIALGCTDGRMSAGGYTAVVVLVGFLSFAWGMFGGALARSTLGAVFQGSVGSFVTGLVLAVPFVVVFGPREFGRPFGPVLLGYYATWVGIGLVLSAITFTAVDRRRVAPRAVADGGRGQRGRPPARRRAWGVRVLVWLAARQAVFVTVAAAAGGLLLGALMLAPDAQPLLLWPAATLGFGVLAGVTTLGEEQSRGVARFWAERRLPLGRMWLAKVGFHFAVAALAGLLMFLPVFSVSAGVPFKSRLLTPADLSLREELGRILWLGLVYGFVLGHLAGMVFRKTVVAGLVAGVLAVTFVGLIGPSVLAGGAPGWMVWGPAVVLLATARLLLYPWATDRVVSRHSVLRAVGGVGLAAALLGGGLAYRVYQIPDVPDRLADSGYEAGLPTKEADDAQRAARAAVAQFRRAAEEAAPLYAGRSRPAPAAGMRAAPLDGNLDPLDRVARVGWTSEAWALKPWLDRVFAADWPRQLEEVAARPAGMFEDPRDLDAFTPTDMPRDLRDMCLALRARGIQRLNEADPDEYPRLLRGGLAVVRAARFKGGWRTTGLALECEEVLLGGLGQWLATAGDRTDLVRGLLPDLRKHEQEMPADPDDRFWADQVVYRNTLDRVATWLPNVLDPRPPERKGLTPDAQSEGETNLVAFAWSVPWERARRDRIVRVRTHPDRDVRAEWLSGLHLRRWARTGRPVRRPEAEPAGEALRRLAAVQVALRVYAADRGGPAPDLAALTPAYLPAVGGDPYAPGRGLGYRVSVGELLEVQPARSYTRSPAAEAWSRLARAVVLPSWPGLFRAVLEVGGAVPPLVGPDALTAGLAPAVTFQVAVPPGAGVLWSTGPDGSDDGARRMAVAVGPALPNGTDWVVVIPPVRPPDGP